MINRPWVKLTGLLLDHRPVAHEPDLDTRQSTLVHPLPRNRMDHHHFLPGCNEDAHTDVRPPIYPGSLRNRALLGRCVSMRCMVPEGRACAQTGHHQHYDSHWTDVLKLSPSSGIYWF